MDALHFLSPPPRPPTIREDKMYENILADDILSILSGKYLGRKNVISKIICAIRHSYKYVFHVVRYNMDSGSRAERSRYPANFCFYVII
jgi:hypothetical protein